MARRAVIEREEVFSAARSLVAEGKEVTALTLLNMLKGGSLTTIYKHLADWNEQQTSKDASIAPTEIPEAVQSAILNTWRVATQEAGRHITAVKEKAAEEVKAAQKQFEDALEVIKKLETDTEEDASRIEKLEAQVAELETALNSAGNDNAALKATTDQMRHQVQAQQAELERLHKDIDADRTIHREEVARLNADHAAAQERANTQAQEMREQLAGHQQRSSQLERERDDAQVRTREIEKRLADEFDRLKGVEQQRDQAYVVREEAIKEAAELRGKADAMKTQISEMVSKLAEGGSKKEKA